MRSQLDALGRTWQDTERNAAQLLKERKNLIALYSVVSALNNSNAELLDLNERVVQLAEQGAPPGRTERGPPQHDADAAPGKERQRPARCRRHRPRSRLPAEP
ncbi:hypothetical protein [Thauera humireducens]|uniref:hypothetical protein n=1 Tax=Thauera humireducens TaxID=1134435 RepID=UPI00311FF8E0